MSMSLQPPESGSSRRRVRALLRPALACAMGVAAAVLLIACGSSGKGLLSAANAGPLKNDIEAVDLAAQEGNGNCTATDAALQRTEQDYASRPSSVDSGLRNTLGVGLKNLRKVATELCVQPLANTTTTATTPPTPTPPTTTSTTSGEEEREKAREEREKRREEEEKAKEETEQPPSQGGGTPPGETGGSRTSPGTAGGATPEESAGNGVGGQESGK
jgi:hypothetical protein